jgi:FG-GAP repeat/Head domain of trimeric autotransporter adhesin
MKLQFLTAALFFLSIAHAQNVGIGITAPKARLHVADSNVLFTGPVILPGTTTYNPPASGAGSRMMWYPQKAAFRVGFVDGTHWDKDSIGSFSFSSGYNTKAIGPVSYSTGGSTIARGNYSTSMGYGTIANGYFSTSMGYGTIANGINSTSMGYGTNTSGDASTSMGYYTHASGYNSTSMGLVTTAQGDQSTSMGLFTNAKSNNSLVIGLYNDTSATNRLFEIGNGTDDNLRTNAMTVLTNGNTGIGTSTPIARLNVADSNVLFTGPVTVPYTTTYNPPASGAGSRMMWYPQKAAFRVGAVDGTHWDKDSIGLYSFSSGVNTRAIGQSSFATGEGTIASGQNSTSMGYQTSAKGDFSTSMGYDTKASGYASTSMGYFTKASGFAATSMGYGTTANGEASTSIGYKTNASGYASTSMGYFTKAISDHSLVIGKYNDTTDSNRLFEIGNGTDDNLRANAMTVLTNGNTGIGSTNPAEKLQVAGNIKTDTVKPNAIKFTPNAGTGKILTSDAAGNANWQALSAGGGVGFGSWGDCSTNSISEYNPVADATGAVSDNFGNSSSISGNYAIVGAPSDDGAAGIDQGSASIYQWNGSNWVLMQKITDATGAAFDHFGVSVSISGNYAIVGAYADDGQGSASIYQWNGSNWVLMQKITDATGAAFDFFGYSVSISGNYTIVGAYGDDGAAGANQGSASIYQWNGGSWVLMQKLTDATGAASDQFGNSVSISGNYAIVGAYGDDGAASNEGSASIYQWNGSNWVLMQKITDAGGAAGDLFGYSVSISGNYAIVGAYGDDGAFADQGSASIYNYNGSSWSLMQKITDAGGAAGDLFGYSVSISGNYAIVGARSDDGAAGADQGSAGIYLRVGLGWQRLQYITDPGGNASDAFGMATAIDGATQRFLIGAPFYANASGKVVFGKVN